MRSFNSNLSRSSGGGGSVFCDSASVHNESTSSSGSQQQQQQQQKFRHGIQKKISRLRSRSVERISQKSQAVRERLQQLQQLQNGGGGGLGDSHSGLSSAAAVHLSQVRKRRKAKYVYKSLNLFLQLFFSHPCRPEHPHGS